METLRIPLETRKGILLREASRQGIVVTRPEVVVLHSGVELLTRVEQGGKRRAERRWLRAERDAVGVVRVAFRDRAIRIGQEAGGAVAVVAEVLSAES